jgi:hypothetical protein
MASQALVPLAVCLCVTVLGAGCGRSHHAPLGRRELPGLSIALPAGDERRSSLDYEKGELVIGAAGGLVTGVRWNVATVPSALAFEMVSGVVANDVGVRVVGDAADLPVGGGLRARRFAIEKDGQAGRMTLFVCTSRLFALYTLGGAADDLHARMLASVDCHPDRPNELAEIESVPIAVELPPGWTRGRADGGQMTFEHEAGDRTLTIMKTIGVMESPDVLASLLAHTSGVKATVTPLPDEADRRVASLDLGNEPNRKGVLVQWQCGKRSYLGLAIATAEQLAACKAILLSARCR